MIARADSTTGKSMSTRSGAGKKTKHVELRFLSVQNLVHMSLLRMAEIEGTGNPADLLTKSVTADVLRRLRRPNCESGSGLQLLQGSRR